MIITLAKFTILQGRKLSDEYQKGIVFYRDKEWTNNFAKDTGLKLEEYNQW